jgi:DNA-binding beta-propeller fold protein YncE
MSRGGADRRPTRGGAFHPIFAATLLLAALCLVANPGPAAAAKLSDQNRDGVVDLADLILFSQDELGQDWQTVDWCAWLEAPHKHEKHLRALMDFTRDYFHCDADDPLVIVNSNDYPTRVAWGPDAQRIYVTDPRVGSIFVYDSGLVLLGQLKGLGKPLGVVVDPLGNIYVGNNQLDNVEVYSPDGIKIATLGAGTVHMPNDLAFDENGKLYVVDSARNKVWIFDPATGENLGHIGAGQLRFPSALAISGQELFVADQANHQVKVFDLQGNLLRSFGSAPDGWFGYEWKGRFVRLQSLAIDATGRLHTLDSHMSIIQILDAATGAYINSYGSEGSAPGQLDLPLDIAISQYGETAVANNKNQRVELLTPP